MLANPTLEARLGIARGDGCSKRLSAVRRQQNSRLPQTRFLVRVSNTTHTAYQRNHNMRSSSMHAGACTRAQRPRAARARTATPRRHRARRRRGPGPPGTSLGSAQRTPRAVRRSELRRARVKHSNNRVPPSLCKQKTHQASGDPKLFALNKQHTARINKASSGSGNARPRARKHALRRARRTHPQTRP